jgi:beta-lactamase class A
MDAVELKSSIEKEFAEVEGEFALAFMDLEKGDKILINEKVEFHAASTMKTPVMIEVFRQAEEGRFRLDDSILVKNEFRSIVDSSLYSMDIDRDSGDDLYDYIGKNRTVRQLVASMITVSSNLATNILIDKVDAQNVTKTMRDLGAENIKVLRGVEDMKAFDLGLSNTTDANDLMIIYEAIVNKRIISESACEEMIRILNEQKFNDMIPKHLPDGIEVAHKTGSISGVRHDSGIVFLPGGRAYVLVILSKNLHNAELGKETAALVSKKIYNYMILK